MSGTWRTLLVSCAWHSAFGLHRQRRPQGPVPGFPPQDSPIWNLKGTQLNFVDAPGVQPFTAQGCWQMGEHLAAAMQCLQSGEDKEHVKKAILSLRAWSYSMWEHRGMCKELSSNGRFLHCSRKLLECIRLASFLKGGPSSLQQVVERSLLLAAPRIISPELLDSVRASSNTKLLATPSLLRRYELALDMALILCSRTNWSSSLWARYGHADSSPMAGFDWLWSQHNQIQPSCLVKCFECIRQVHEWVVACAGTDGSEDEQQHHQQDL